MGSFKAIVIVSKMGMHETGLSIFGDREQGQDVRAANVTAVQTVANILKSSLGPQGLDKMIVDDKGDITITNDGSTILQKLEVQHPAAKILVDLAALQDKEVGDGTTSVVLFAAELLRRANELVKMHVHPTTIISGYRLAMKASVKFIHKNMGHKVEDLGDQTLIQIANTTLNSKFIGAENKMFSKLIVDAVKSVKIRNAEGKAKFPVNQINVIESHGKSSKESRLLENGYALQLARVAQGCPTLVEKAKIALLDFDLKKYCMKQAEILVSDPAELEKIRQKEMDITRDRLRKIIDAGANVILTTKGMDDMSIKYLVDAGVLGVRRVDRVDMRRIAKITGGAIQLTLATLDGDEAFHACSLGTAECVEEERVGDNDFIFIKGCTHGRVSTLLLRGANEYMLEETARSVHDALMAVSKTCESMYVVPGGGCVETALNLHLEEFANEVDGKEQLAVMEFAEALITIPTTLTVNASLDAIDLTSKLRKAHYEAMTDPTKAHQARFSLDLINNSVSDGIANGILEPMVSKLKSLKFATEAATTIIRIDDLIKLAPEEPKQ